jgi:hypothetical protein
MQSPGSDYSSTLKKEATCSSVTSVDLTTDYTTEDRALFRNQSDRKIGLMVSDQNWFILDIKSVS